MASWAVLRWVKSVKVIDGQAYGTLNNGFRKVLGKAKDPAVALMVTRVGGGEKVHQYEIDHLWDRRRHKRAELVGLFEELEKACRRGGDRRVIRQLARIDAFRRAHRWELA